MVALWYGEVGRACRDFGLFMILGKAVVLRFWADEGYLFCN